MERDENCNVGCCGGSLFDEKLNPLMSHGNFPSLKQTAFEVCNLKKIFKSYYRRQLNTSCSDIYSAPRKVGYISGANMFLRRKALEKVGFLDEDFFLYFEDTELCFRLLKGGYYSFIVPEAKIIHLFGQSSHEIQKDERLTLREQSRFKFFRKCYGPKAAFVLKILYILKNIERLLLNHDRQYARMIGIILKA
jgi:GT2 family glycosyltransferase